MINKPIRAAIYSRVSTDEQHTDNQTEKLKEFAAIRGFQIVMEYAESASAWKDGHQTELKRLKENARKGQFDVVLVWALDRLSRQGAASILTLVNTLKTYNVRIISLQESWTEAPPEVADILYAVVGWVAEMESKRRSERTKAGMERAKKAGIHTGRPQGKKDSKKRKKRG
jgi:DNA invertase Pin-like site-specific DNA recombinase